MTEAVSVYEPKGEVAKRAELTVQDVIQQVKKIQEVMAAVMRENEHYGVIPGTNKPTLLKPGAEKLCLTFRLDPQYEVQSEREGDHLAVTSRCILWHIPTGLRYGSGMGSCSTRESKYAYRQAARKCLACGKEVIIKGKAEFGGGWLCFLKKGGCGAKYKDGDGAIESQVTGRVINEDKADQFNTVLKMANKRSLVAAVLNVTAASDIFTQDLEDVSAAEEPPIRVDSPTQVQPNSGSSGLLLPEASQDRAILWGRIQARQDQLGLSADDRQGWWRRFCGEGTPETADLAALTDLFTALGKALKKMGK